MKKVAIICENYPPDCGGIAESAKRLASGLSNYLNIHIVRFPCGNPEEGDSHRVRKESNNLVVHDVAPFVNGWTVPPNPYQRAKILNDTANKLASIFFPEDIHVIHGFGLQNAGLVAARLSHLLGLPLIQSVRGNDVGRNAFDGFRRKPLELSLKCANTVVAVNSWLADLLRANFPWIERRLRIINNGIKPIVLPTDEFKDKLASSLQLNSKAPLIGFVGTLREKKGPHLVSILVRDFIKIYGGKLIVIGDVDIAHFRQAGWNGGILDNDFVVVRRAKDRRELFGLISSCDWLVFPSLDDGMANGLLEAMACARPVICSSVFSDVITNWQDGVIASPLNPSAYVSICRTLWNNPDLRKKIGVAAKKKIEQNYNVDIELNSWAELYNNVKDRS